MDDIVDWYWAHGTRRGMDPNDPERACRRMSVSHWLDPVARLVRRRETITRNMGGKACIAIWGPSQTGKSTLLSRYVDGIIPDGSDSALSWDPTRPVRFSPTQDWSSISGIYPHTLVFNPFNQGSDASGLATRYVLRADDDATVNHGFPVEIKLASNMQLMHALSIGYQEECRSVLEVDAESSFRPTSFREALPVGSSEQTPDRNAYGVLRDLADAIEVMRGQARFEKLFAAGGNEWRRTLRPFLMDSHGVASLADAEDLRAKLLWDGSDRLSAFYREVSELGGTLRRQWGDRKIVATPDVAAVLLDIESYRISTEPVANENAQRVKRSVAGLSWTIDEAAHEVRLSVGSSGSPEISGTKFGYFQALCAELVVPLKKSALQTPEKAPFLALLEKCDLLDLPGLSNVNHGGTATVDDDAFIDLENASEIDLFKRVFKEGKTQSFVYGYANDYCVDAFLVLVRGDRSPSKSSKLAAGIRQWQRAYDPDWNGGQTGGMPIFLDMTFFATCINSVAMNGVGTGLTPIVSRVQDEMRFAAKESSRWFTTTYPQFPGGAVTDLVGKASVVDKIMHDEVFLPRTGLTRETLEAVYETDGGVNHMVEAIATSLNVQKRRMKCAQILESDRAELRAAIQPHLPTEAATGAAALQQSLRETGVAIEGEIAKIEAGRSSRTYAELSMALKRLFGASPETFDAIPENAYNEELNGYVAKQVSHWYESQSGGLTDTEWLDLPHQQVLVGALRNVLENRSSLLETFIQERLGQLDDRISCREGTYALAVAIENILWSDVYDRTTDACYVGAGNTELLDTLVRGVSQHSRQRTDSAHYLTVIKPVLDRLSDLEKIVTCGARPAQPGDDDLKQIFNRLTATGI